jgi:hypothetical protein
MLRKLTFIVLATLLCPRTPRAADLHLNDLDYFDTQGLSVLAYQNLFHDVFRDQKLGGIEIIQHGERIATDGEVRLLPTPEQWDRVPKFVGRKRGAAPDQLIAASGYPDLHFTYRIEVTVCGGRRHELHPRGQRRGSQLTLVYKTISYGTLVNQKIGDCNVA